MSGAEGLQTDLVADAQLDEHLLEGHRDVDGAKYLVSTRGESQWVKNVRGDTNVMVGSTEYVAREIPEQDRQPILTAYRKKAGRVVEGYFSQLPHESDHPVFVLTPSAENYTL